jgi:DNA repair exonuclease SbcCD nuclease subunit
MKSPIAVLISDVHYSVHTLEKADKAVRTAISHANDLKIPLIVCGDLHDTKANLRGECVNVMMDTFILCKVPAIVLVGNHDKINEKSDNHSLTFLRYTASVVAYPTKNLLPYVSFIPYQHDTSKIKNFLSTLTKGTTVIMHQGLKDAASGEYYQDATAIPQEWVADFRVISGHYHCRQDIKTGPNGLFSYVGNPYTVNFGEANDPEKGYEILYDDGSLEFVALKLPRHTVIECDATTIKPHDLTDLNIVHVKYSGPSDELSKISKDKIKAAIGIPGDFRLSLISTSSENKTVKSHSKTPDKLIFDLIDNSREKDSRKARLKLMVMTLLDQGS